MTGAVLPGNSTVELKTYPVPTPGYGQVLIKVKASSICGSDIRAIYREHLGVGDEAYQGFISGHEPSGQVVEVGPGCKEYKTGDRVIVYHISGCGVCDDCKHGYMISCHGKQRAAYGWQRDGGHADYLLAEENTLVHLPDNLTYEDGALIACGFGTAWEALTRMRVSGQDRLLVTGLGPVGLAAAQLGKALGADKVIGVDVSQNRIDLAKKIGVIDEGIVSNSEALAKILDATNGKGTEASIDCSGAAPARKLALEATRQWGRCAFVGEGGSVAFDVSPVLIHKQITLYGSWVTSLKHMSDLAERISRWGIHPDITVTDRFPLSKASEAYALADKGQSGKIVIVFD
jgi:threonine dehydrogenase-like Zn-dependent dehydrogenase